MSTAPKATPKFFSEALTGSGGATGLLNRDLVPDNRHFTSFKEVATMCGVEARRSSRTAGGRIHTIPFATTSRRSLSALAATGGVVLAPPGGGECFPVVLDSGAELLLSMTPQAMLLREPSGRRASGRQAGVSYRMELWHLPADHAGPVPVGPLSQSPSVALEWSASPINEAEAFIAEQAARLGARATSLDELGAWLRTYPLHERLSALAAKWSSPSAIGETLSLVRAAARHAGPDALGALARQLRYLENYPVPLEAYRALAAEIESLLDPSTAASLAQHSMGLLLEHTLSRLGRLRPQLPRLQAAPLAYSPGIALSDEQRAAVTATGPLDLVVAGAGTGKSTTINERVRFLLASGVERSDLTVLSFTNAAADHISEIAPGVGSMTIAQMVIAIYSLAHPGHRVSSADTIRNSLRVFAPADPVAERLGELLTEMDAHVPGTMTRLNLFVQAHFDRVIALLDRIGQTTLDLQIIICYQRIGTMAVPEEIASRHLIIDEVQDNSVFEFVFVLRYVASRRQSLYIVGDASQTLYEFRFANPRALSALESSGAFDVHTLSVNFRSDQEVLDYANTVLAGLETNRRSGIRLRSSAGAPVTAETFRARVGHHHLALRRLDDLVGGGEMDRVLRTVIGPQYTAPRLGAGEQVAHLAYSRREAAELQRALEELYPGASVVSLMSDIARPTDVLSSFVARFWRDIEQVPPQYAAWTVERQITAHAGQLLRRDCEAARRQVASLVSQWWVASASTISAWVGAYSAGRIGRRRFFDELRASLLGFEISHNQAGMSINKERSARHKEEGLVKDADIIVSTIHGVKGLEFPHVVVFAREPGAPDQALQRLHYVAMTRATRSEFILSYSTDPVSRYGQAYADLLAGLPGANGAAA